MVVPITLRDVFATNCYFFIDEQTQHGFLVDCGAQGEAVARLIKERGWTIDGILLTHGHFDHTAGVGPLQKALGCPVYLHEGDARYLTDTRLNLSALCNRNVKLVGVKLMRDGDTITLSTNENFSLQCIHTPGHTPGSCTYYNKKEQLAFVGDTIFRDQPGTSEYFGGDEHLLSQSIGKILQLPEPTTLYSGHSQPTTVEHELFRYAR